MTPRVWTEVSLQPEALARLKEQADVVEHGTLETLVGADVAIIGDSNVNSAFLDAAGPDLKMVIRHGIGYNSVDVPAASARGILAANTPDAPTESTAEHTVALLLAVAKRIAEHDRVLRDHTSTSRRTMRGTDVRGLILGVVGFGRIGRRVAAICTLGLQMRVLAYDPFAPAMSAVPDNVQMLDTLEEVLAQADFVTLHTPLTAATRHLIGERELRHMKHGAYLINVSRGPVVDEAALIRILQEGHLGGAGLDVTDPEPPHPDSPLLRLPNVIVTPHVATNTPQAAWRMGHSVVDQVLQLLSGERPAHLIDPSVWPGRMERAG